ncbi:hypothetical protein PM01_08630 [Sulfitobacter pontiacus 3SOLIMAR09]|nr:hypothetical protein PM01_08630 [Sulfitobacter pontiacus 3SOLIMAR09]
MPGRGGLSVDLLRPIRLHMTRNSAIIIRIIFPAL